MENRDKALSEFLTKLTAETAAHFARWYPNVTPPTFVAMPGTKFTRIVQVDANNAGRSAWGFVDAEGNLYKPDSWKRPAKHARGTIFAERAPLNVPYLR